MHDRFIGPLPREGSVASTSDYVSQSYSYSSILNKSETGKTYLFHKVIISASSGLVEFLHFINMKLEQDDGPAAA